MNPHHQIEPKSTDHLLTCLGLAIDETKLLRSILKFKDMARSLNEDDKYSGKLNYLNKEIAFLEAKLSEIRSQANKI